jgi:diadenosine tetraphosphate (Ap4A) HIT family hydrolase
VNIDTLEVAQQEGRAPWTEIEIDTRDFVVYNDIYPVTEGHTLIVPKQATQEDILKCMKFAVAMGQQNVGINMGESAGQTCMYPHIHLIFRRDGDMENPKGGVRGVIPSKQKY